MFDETLLRKVLREELGGIVRRIVRDEVNAAFDERFEPFKEFCIKEFERINGQLADIPDIKNELMKHNRRIEKLENNHHYA